MKHNNGLTSILINDKNSLVAAVIVFVRVGSVDEKSSQSGLSHFLEHLMFKGSKNYSGDLMVRNVEKMGGDMNAATSKEFTMYYVSAQKNGVEESIKMLADVMRNPLFPQDEIDIEKKVVIEEIRKHSDNPESLLYEKFYETIYNESALRNIIIGNSQVIANISREEIYNYYKAHYVPEKMVVVVSGNFNEPKVKKLIHETFGKFEKQPAPADPLLTENMRDGIDVVEYGKVEVGYMLTGFLGPGINEEDIYIVDLAVEILGSGKTSRLYKSLYLKQHLVYAIDVAFSTEKGAGNVYIMSVFDPKNICEIKTEIKKQIKNIVSNGITEEELRRSKLSIKTDWKFSLETPLGIANTFGYWHLMGNAEFITEYIKKLESFTCSDIVKFFKKYYSQKTIFNVALLPKIK